MAMRNPFETLQKNLPKTGTVQNTGGLAPSTAPLSKRPVSTPGVRLDTPGPTPMSNFGASLEGAAPGMGGPIVTPSAQAAQSRASARKSGSQRAIKKFQGQQYGRSGGISKGTGESLEDQIRGALGGMFGGQTSQGFVDRARGALGSAVEGQRAQATRRIDDDAIKRGLFKSGIPAELSAAAGNSAQGAFSQGLADILSQAENQDIQGRQFATGQAGNLLGMNRSYDQYLQSQINQAQRRGAGGPGTTTIVDPDTGQSYEIDQSVLSYF